MQRAVSKACYSEQKYHQISVRERAEVSTNIHFSKNQIMADTGNILDFIRKNSYIVDHPEIGQSIINTLLGEHLGSGTFRDVYEYGLDKDWVIKVENGDSEGDNWAEWRIWYAVKDRTDGTKDWFAPCSWISNDGKLLIQKRTKPLRTKYKKIPEKIPSFFTDIKDSNFGWIGNRLVCHDYSFCIEMFSNHANPKKLRHFKKELGY